MNRKNGIGGIGLGIIILVIVIFVGGVLTIALRPLLIDEGDVDTEQVATTENDESAGAVDDDTDDEEADAVGNVVEVRLISYAINMPDTLEAGTHTFEVTNTADIPHGFIIDSETDVIAEFDTNFEPTETREITVDLEPGTYTVYCPVGNHAEEEGMTHTLVITEPEEG